MLFLKEAFEKVDFEKHHQTTKSLKNYPIGKELNKSERKLLLVILCMSAISLSSSSAPDCSEKFYANLSISDSRFIYLKYTVNEV